MRKWNFIAVLCALFLMGSAAYSQQFDLAMGGSGTTATSASNVSLSSTSHSPQSIGGGTFLSFSGDFLTKKRYGFAGEVSWRASQAQYSTPFGSIPYRPIFWDFNGAYGGALGKHAGGIVMAGIGVESVRFYGTLQCSQFSGCTNYISSNHFLGHFGGALRLYAKGNFFVSPEAHLYLIRNNFEFSGPWATRFGMSIGYTFRSQY